MAEIEKEIVKPAEFSNVEDMVAYLRSDKVAAKDKVAVVLNRDGNPKGIEFTRHVNTDGSRGGFVASSVPRLHISASYIDPTAVVYGTFDITNSRIGANSTVISFGKDTAFVNGDQNTLADTVIGSGSTIKADGAKSCIVLRGATIEDGVDIDVKKGRLYIARSTIGSGVATEALVADPKELLILNIEESTIGRDSKISLDKQPPRLGIANMSVPDRSAVSIDMDNYAMEVRQPGKMPNDPYTVMVPELSDGTLSGFIGDAEAYTGSVSLAPGLKAHLQIFAGSTASLKKLERVVLLAKYVYDTIPYDGSTYEGYGDPAHVPLDYFIDNKGGVCFEHALMLYEVLEKERREGSLKVKPMFVSGAAIGSDPDSLHAWVEVEIDGEVFVIDPTNPMPYTIAGMRGQHNEFIRISGIYNYDYVYDGEPIIKPL